MKAGKKTSSRKTGSKNKKVQERARRMAGVAAAIVASASTVATTEDERTQINVEVPCPGITAKDLLLTLMRTAWKDAHRKADEAEKLEGAAVVLEREAAAETLGSEASLVALRGRHAIRMDAAMRLRARASSLRLDVKLDIDFAVALATAILPYEHPKLMHIDQTIAVISQNF